MREYIFLRKCTYLKKTTRTVLLFLGMFFSITQNSYAQCTGPANDCDNDGIVNADDLDDDNDGILDTNECNIVTNNFTISGGNGGSTTTFNFDRAETANFDFDSVDNSLEIRINGGELNANNILQLFGTAGGGEVLLEFLNGSTIGTPWLANSNGLPRLRVLIDAEGVVNITGTSSRTSTILEPMRARDGSSFNTIAFVQGVNNFSVENLDGPGPDSIRGTATITSACFDIDTDNDTIPDHLDTDSDNDGCSDALEGGDNILTSAIDSNGMLIGTPDPITGVPNNVNVTTGQSVGSSANNNAFDTFNQCDEDGDGIIAANDICAGFDDNADNDNDNVPDGCDLDDDNDGILDADEGLLGTELNSLNGVNDANGITVNLSNTSNCPTGQTSVGSSIVSFDIGWNNGVGGGFVNTGNPATSNTEAILTLSVNGVNYLTIETPSDGASDTDNATEFGGDAIITPLNGALFTNTPIAPLVASSQGANYINHSPYNNWNYAAIKVTLPLNVMGNVNIDIDLNSDDFSILNAEVESSCSLDSDNDGIPNYFDTDSDNDGCPDAIEADAAILTTQLQELTGGSNGVGSSLLNLGRTVNTTSTSTNYGVPVENALGENITNIIPQATTVAVTNLNDKTACNIDLSVSKTADKSVLKLGENVMFTIILNNNGPQPVNNAMVKDLLPAGLTYNQAASTIPTNTSYTASTGIWNLSNLIIDINQTIELKIAATVTTTGAIVINTTEVFSAKETDSDSIPNNDN